MNGDDSTTGPWTESTGTTAKSGKNVCSVRARRDAHGMKTLWSHLKHGLRSLVALAVPLVPLVAADTQVRNVVHHELVSHPAIAVYVPLAAVLAGAVEKQLAKHKQPTVAVPVPAPPPKT